MTIEDQSSGIDPLRTTLARAYRAAAESRYLHRLHCVLLMLHGLSSAKVAAWFFHDETTVAGWRRRFERLGTQGLLDQERAGRPSLLDLEQLAELQRCLRRPPGESGFPTATKWQGKLVAAWLQRCYGLYLSLRQCQRLLRDAEKRDAPADARRRTPSRPPLPAATRDSARAIRRSATQP
ncbi:MAG TPA: helix-turn-helix domain-containing protein [Candidatus Accumulibacter sp.]|nr:MAG: Transposase [Candidatus Accumulibacter sp. SK-11]HCN70073.1 helix-turn-helix domain-containing protein [Accumulibacter sp.]